MAIPVGTAVGYLTLDYSQFSSNLTTAVNEASSLSGKLSDTLGSGFRTIGDSISTVGRTMTTGITIPLGVAGASAIKFGAEFDKQMSAVKAVTNATTDEFNRMRDAAIQWGGKTVYTAAEASQALYYMGLAGWDAERSISALGPVLNLAAAGNLELDRTSDIVTDAMTAMKVEAGQLTNGIENTTHFVNVMAQTMSNSNTDVDQLGEAFKYVTPLAGSLGYSIDDLGLALGLMANVGVKASQAGTSLRQALKSVIAPTSDAQSAMDKYGISLYDSEGKAKSLRQFMQELRGTFNDLGIDIHDANGEVMDAEQIMEEYGKSLPLTQQEKLNDIVTIFGTRALPGVLGIIEQSDEKFNDLAASIDGADNAFDGLGAAAGIAEIQMDNLQGDWIRFTSALGTAKIAISDIANGALRQFIQSLTELVTKFNNLDTAQQEHILKIVALIAAIGPLLFIFGKLISSIGTVITTFNSLKKAFDLVNVGFTILGTGAVNAVQGFKLAQAGFTALGAEASPLGASLSGIVTALQPMAGVILGVVAAVGVLVAAFVHLWKNNEEFRNNVIGIWNDLKSKFAEAGQAIVDSLNELGFCFEDFKDVVDAVVNGIKVIWNGLCEFLGPVILAVIKVIASGISGIVTVFTGVVQIITGLIKGFKDGDWTMLWEGLKNVVNGFASFITNSLSSVFSAIYSIIQNIVNLFGVDWSTSWEEAKQNVLDFVTNIVTWFKELPSKILNELNVVITNIKTFGISIVNNAKEIGKNFVTNFINFFSNLPYKIGYVIGYVITSVIKFGVDMINNAKEYVNITTPYLILDEEMTNVLCFAAKKGVDVRVITPHIPDKWYVYMIAWNNYPRLISSGVKVYEYTPGFIHAKGCIADGKAAMIGTINFDYRSFYLHFESAAILYQSAAIGEMKRDFDETVRISHQITLNECNDRPFLKKVSGDLLNMFAPLL